MSSCSRGFAAMARRPHSFFTASMPCRRAAGTFAGAAPSLSRSGPHEILLLLSRPRQLLRSAVATAAAPGGRSSFSSVAQLRSKAGQRLKQKKPKHKQPAAVPAKPQPVRRTAAAAAGEATASAVSGAAAAATAAAHHIPVGPGAARSFADLLGRRGAPTLLYEAPSHFWFRASCLSAGVFCIGYTVVNYWSIYLRPPEGLAWWVPHAFGVICVVMAGLGGYFIMGGSRIIRVIQAIPAARLEPLAGPGPAKKAMQAAGNGAAPVFLEIEIGRMVPLLPARKLYVAPTSLALPCRLAVFGIEGEHHSSSAGVQERVEARRAEQERRKKAREYEMSHIMTAPFRHAGQALGIAWVGVRRAFSREGFVKVEVDGQLYKLDVTGGWALENGRALDRLATVKENAF